LVIGAILLFITLNVHSIWICLGYPKLAKPGWFTKNHQLGLCQKKNPNKSPWKQVKIPQVEMETNAKDDVFGSIQNAHMPMLLINLHITVLSAQLWPN
jgi:hypothetical protein